MDEDLLTVDELCKWLKITRKTTERWRKEGMPFVKIKGSVRFERKAIEHWIEENGKGSKN
jgi:excisionase family DNA binding protein